MLSGGPHSAVAHMAYFERREWKAWLVDPPPRRRQDRGPTLEAVLLAYYRPFSWLLDERGAGDVASHNGAVYDMAELPEVDLRIGLRSDLRAALTLPALADEGRGTKLRLGLAGLSEELTSPRQDLAEQAAFSLQRAAQLAEEEAETGRSAGPDGVLLEAGDSWNWEAMALEPSERRAGR